MSISAREKQWPPDQHQTAHDAPRLIEHDWL